jgi:hypothetical protein
MTRPFRFALLLGIAVLGACAPSPTRDVPRLQSARPVAFGQPARAGIDGPVGTTGVDTPALVWTGQAPVSRTTADLMAEAAARQPRFQDWRERPHLRKQRPDRRALPQHPDALDLPQRAPSFVRRGGVPSVAQTMATPNVDVVTLAETNSLPPDTMGDVGPTQYLAALNGWLRSLDKATGLADGVLDLDIGTFFGAVVPGGHFTSDPRVRFDRRTQRWFVLMISVGVPNRYLIATSDSAAITGSTSWEFSHWTNTRTRNAGGTIPCLGDYPSLGLDEDALYVGVNQFCGADLNTLSFDSTSVYVVKKGSLVNGASPPQVAQFDGVLPGPTAAGIFTPQGVDNVDSGTSTGYVIGVANTAFGQLVLHRISDPAGTPSISAAIAFNVPHTQYPANVPHPGSSVPLDGLDDRLLQAVIRNGRLWTTHQIGVIANGTAPGDFGTVDRTAVRWYELQNLDATPSVAQSGTIYDPAGSNPLSYWMGAIMPNGQGHVALGMSRSGAAGFVNTAFTGRLAGDPANTMDAPQQYSSNAGFTYNVQVPPDDAQRWGDYSYTSVDPDDDMTFWTLQQYVNATDSYAVRLVRLLAPAPAALSAGAVSPSTVAAGRAGVTLTVTGSPAGGRGFFEPGPAFVRHLTAAFSGAGITVTNVAVTSPTTLTLTVNTLGAATGARALTVTNPDGQTSTLASALTVTAATPGPPVFDGVPANRTLFDAGTGATTGALAFQVADPDGTPVVLTATSSNTTVIPANRVQLTGTDSDVNRTIRVTSAGHYGASTITLQAASGGQTTTATFVVTVSPSAVPGAPQAFAVTVIRNRVTFTWQPPSTAGTEPVSAYRIEAGVTPGGISAVLPVSGAVLSYTVFTAPDGVFFARVKAQTAAGMSAASNEVQFATGQGGPPLAPLALLATVQNTNVSLQWTENPFGPVITAYYLVAGTGPGLADIGVLPLPPTARTFAVVAPPGTYYVRMLAVNATGASLPSNEAVLLAQAGTCTIPEVPTGLATTSGGGRLTLGWAAPTSGAIPESYVLSVGSVSGGADRGVIPLPGTLTAVSGLVPAGPYYLRLAAANGCGASASSTGVFAVMP